MSKEIMAECLVDADEIWVEAYGSPAQMDGEEPVGGVDKQAIAILAVALYQERCKSLDVRGVESTTGWQPIVRRIENTTG